MTVELRDTLTAQELMAENREAWLRAVTYRIVVDIMEPAGYGYHHDLRKVKDGLEMVEGKTYEDDETELVPLTEKLNISCSWPHRGGVARKQRVIGQCWSNMSSAANDAELFISPMIDDGLEAAEVIVHELLHAAVGTRHKHDRTFAAGCARIGLEGKPTATEAGDELRSKLQGILLAFPPYPHAKLAYEAPLKSDRNRQLKVYCKNDECPTMEEGGFKFRLTRKWIDQYAAGKDRDGDPKIVMQCPGCNEMMAVELPDEDTRDEGE